MPAALIVTLLLCSCGRSSAVDGRSAVAREQAFRDALNAICKTNTLTAVRVGTPRSISQLAMIEGELAPWQRQEARELNALVAPPAYRPVYRNFLALQNRGLKLSAELRAAALADDAARVSAIDAEIPAANPQNDLDSRFLHVDWCLSTVTGPTTTTIPVPTTTIAS